jgi:hypothetical protein
MIRNFGNHWTKPPEIPTMGDTKKICGQICDKCMNYVSLSNHKLSNARPVNVKHMKDRI